MPCIVLRRNFFFPGIYPQFFVDWKEIQAVVERSLCIEIPMRLLFIVPDPTLTQHAISIKLQPAKRGSYH